MTKQTIVKKRIQITSR